VLENKTKKEKILKSKEIFKNKSPSKRWFINGIAKAS